MDVLTIELERPGACPTFRPGETIRGTLEVRAPDACRCKALTLSLGWHTRGRGNRDEHPVEQRTLFEGQWQAGAIERYPFELAAPCGPFSYEGTMIELLWAVRARADVPWAIDPKAVAELRLVPWDADALAERARTTSHYRQTHAPPPDEFSAGMPIQTASNRVVWSVELAVDPVGTPAWKLEVPLTVRPPRLERLGFDPALR